VVDTKTGRAGYFRVDTATGKPVRIPTANVRVFEEPTTANPEIVLEQKIPPDTVTEEQQLSKDRREWLSSNRILICTILAVVAALAVLGFFFYRSPGALKGIGILNTHIFQLIAR
jgi:hypothetical protein